MAVLSIDAGTSVIKAAVHRGADEIARASAPTPTHRPRPGHCEQDMSATWHAVVEAVRSATAQVPDQIDALTTTAQGDGCWLVDRSLAPVGPAILWNDGRAGAITDRWQRDGTLRQGHERNGSATFPGLLNAILAWLAQHQPQRLAQAHAALTCNGWLHAQLTGRLVTDRSDASAPFLDHDTGRYAADLPALFGVAAHVNLLPEIVDNAVHPLTGPAARSLGLTAGLPVVMAPYDVPATALGLGVTDIGQAYCILGTTLCAAAPVTHRPVGGEPTGLTLSTGPGRPLLRVFATLAGAETLTWTARMLGLSGPTAVTDLAELAGTTQPGAGGIRMLPYLSPAGERAPFLAPSARGTIVGLTLEHTRAQLARAAYEGLAAAVADCLAATGPLPSEVRVCGGGARSALWCQLIADMTGASVLRAPGDETGTRGAVAYARSVLTGTDLAVASRRADSDFERIEPDARRNAQATQVWAQLRQLRELSRQSWQLLAGAADPTRKEPR